MPDPCHSEWPWGPQLARTRKEWASPVSQQRSGDTGRPKTESKLPTLQFPPIPSVWPGQPTGLGTSGLASLAGQAVEGKETDAELTGYTTALRVQSVWIVY